MSSRINEQRRNGTGVPGVRLNIRHGYLVLDVSWHADGRRRSTSFLIDTKGPFATVKRAMELRTEKVGAEYDITPQQAWRRLQGAR